MYYRKQAVAFVFWIFDSFVPGFHNCGCCTGYIRRGNPCIYCTCLKVRGDVLSQRVLNLTGQRFGKLKAVSRSSNKEAGYYLWNCICDCGGRIQVSTKKLKRGAVTNCGCVPQMSATNGSIAEDISGQKFGNLTAISQEPSCRGKTRWLCGCECGGMGITTTSMMKSGDTWNCGCDTKRLAHTSILDLRGRRFGRLVAQAVTDRRDSKGSVFWICRCDCGNTCEVTADALKHSNTTSCGCRKQEIKDSIGEQLTFLDGTCVEWLRSRKHRCDNSSGFRGVSQSPNGKWLASIGFKRKRYHIGTFDSFEKAKSARQKLKKHCMRISF